MLRFAISAFFLVSLALNPAAAQAQFEAATVRAKPKVIRSMDANDFQFITLSSNGDRIAYSQPDGKGVQTLTIDNGKSKITAPLITPRIGGLWFMGSSLLLEHYTEVESMTSRMSLLLRANGTEMPRLNFSDEHVGRLHPVSDGFVLTSYATSEETKEKTLSVWRYDLSHKVTATRQLGYKTTVYDTEVVSDGNCIMIIASVASDEPGYHYVVSKYIGDTMRLVGPPIVITEEQRPKFFVARQDSIPKLFWLTNDEGNVSICCNDSKPLTIGEGFEALEKREGDFTIRGIAVRGEQLTLALDDGFTFKSGARNQPQNRAAKIVSCDIKTGEITFDANVTGTVYQVAVNRHNVHFALVSRNWDVEGQGGYKYYWIQY